MLSAQTQTLDEGTVTVDVNALEVIKHTTTVADHQQQTTTGVVIVLVLLEVLGQVGDTLAQQRDLDLGGTRVAFVRRVLGDDFLLFFSRKCTASSLWLLRGAPGFMPVRSLSAGETRQWDSIGKGSDYFRPFAAGSHTAVSNPPNSTMSSAAVSMAKNRMNEASCASARSAESPS